MAGTALNPEFHDTGKHQILIVDDMKDNARILDYFLRQHHYLTAVVHCGEEAISYAEEHKPDLILLDINMPGMNGMAVLKHLRSQTALDNTGVILLTASGHIDELLDAFSSGADDFIQKPYNHIEMLARVQSVLNMRDTQMKLIEANAQLDEFNRDLEKKVAEHVVELEKVNRLRRYFSPQVAETFLRSDVTSFINERKVISFVFLDLSNFT
ncbi:MAG: response regulator [Lentisphaeraceae bacterium]|nr:response regulator [Lentisphaeraceae bacterium]